MVIPPRPMGTPRLTKAAVTREGRTPRRTHFFDRKLFVGLDLDLASLFERLLLDERRLQVRWRKIVISVISSSTRTLFPRTK